MMRRSFWAGVLGAALLAASAAAQTKVEYMAVLLGGKKVGYAQHTREVAAGKVTTTEDMTLTLARMGMEMTIRQVETAVETKDGKPLSFKSVQDLGLMAQTIEGKVRADGKVEVTTGVGTRQSQKVMDWPEGALLPQGLRLLSAAKGLKEGTEYTAKVFSPGLLTALDVSATVGGKKDVDLFGRIVSLTEVTTVMSAPTGAVKTTSYVDENLEALKTIVPMMGMNLELVACSKEFALSKGDTLDFFEKVIVASPSPLEGVGEARSITYEIEPVGADAKLGFLSSPSQKATAGSGGGVTVTVAPIAPAKGVAFPYKGTDAAARKALQATRFLTCDAKEVAGLAKIAVAGAPDAAEAARRIESYVRKYVTTKDLSIGYATALEVAKSRQGDCTEHAVLAAAMCRAAGIPAETVTGLAHVKRLGEKTDVFVPHAWFRAFVGDKWVDYDAALGGYDAGHIAFVAGDGEPAEFFGVVSTLGNLKIVRVSVQR